MQKEHEINFDDKKFVSLKEAAKISRYAKDYIGQLCRGKKIEAKRLGRDWFVNIENLISYKQEVHGEQATIFMPPLPVEPAPIAVANKNKIRLISPSERLGTFGVRNFDVAEKKLSTRFLNQLPVGESRNFEPAFEKVILSAGKEQYLEKLFNKKNVNASSNIPAEKDAWDGTLFADFPSNTPDYKKDFIAENKNFAAETKTETPRIKTNFDFNPLRALFKPVFLAAVPLIILAFIIVRDPAQVAASMADLGKNIVRTANHYADSFSDATNQTFSKLNNAGDPIIRAIHDTDTTGTIYGALGSVKYAATRMAGGFVYQYNALFKAGSDTNGTVAQLPNVRLSVQNLSDTSWPYINISLPEFPGKHGLMAFAETVSDFVDAVHNRSGEALVFARDSAIDYLRSLLNQTSKFATIIRERFSSITQKPSAPPPAGETPAVTPVARESSAPSVPVQLTSAELTQLKNIVVADLTGKGLIVERTIEKPTIIERTLERIISGVSPQDLDEKLSILNNKILSQIADLKNQLAARTQENFSAIALTNKIDQLTGTKLYNVTVSGMAGLTDSDIPNDITASNYLPLSGGTLTGALTGTSLTLSGDLNVSGTQTLSGALSVPYFSATSTTHASFINYSLAVGTSTPYATLSVWGSGTTTNRALEIANSASTTLLTVLDNGNVGIATTSPYAKLSVSGEIVAAYFTATTSTASQIPYASSTAITVSDTASTTNLVVSNVSTFKDFTAANSTTTNATTTNFAVLATASSTDLIISGNATLSKFTPNSVIFSSTGGLLSQNNASFSWNNSATRLSFPYASSTSLTASQGAWLATDGGMVGIGTTSPYSLLSISNSASTAVNTPLFTIASTTAGTATSTLLTVLANGNVGVGTASPSAQLNIVGSSNNELTIADYGGGTGVIARMYAANGSIASPTAVITANNLGGITGFGHNGTSFVRGGRILINADEYWSSSTNGGNITFETAPSGSASAASVERMRLTSAGNVGIGTTTPAYPLDVYGFINTNKYSGYKQDGNTVLYASTTNQSLAVGIGAAPWMSATSTVLYSTAVGYNALNATPTSGIALYNTAVGWDALQANTTGNTNSAFGANALLSNTTGLSNAAYGVNALSVNTTGSGNTAFGDAAGYGDGTTVDQRSAKDDYATFLGYQASRNESILNTIALTNITAIGKNARVGQSNALILGGTGSDAVNVGIGTTSPYSILSISNSASTAVNTPLFTIASTTAGTATSTLLTVLANGNVGVGTDTPNTLLDVSSGNTNNKALAIFGNNTVNNSTQIAITSTDDSRIYQYNGSGILKNFLNSNGSGYLNGGSVGIGTTTPNWLLQEAGTRPFFTLSDTAAGTNLKHWYMASEGGNLYMGTTTDSYATTTGYQALTILNNGNVGVGIANPAWKFEVTRPNSTAYTPSSSSLSEPAGSTLAITNREGVTQLTGVFQNFYNSANGSDWYQGAIGDAGTYTGNFVIGSRTGVTSYQEIMRMTSAGNVGIGTTTPAYPLDVYGFINTNKYSGYKQDGNTVLYASTTNFSLAVGASGAAAWMSATSSPFYSTAVGYNALNTAPTNGLALSNSAFGFQALALNTAGYHNTAIGFNALVHNTTGFANVALGYQAGAGDGVTADQRSVIDNYGTFLGWRASRDAAIASTTVLTNITAIGKNAHVAQSNSVILGGTGSDAVNVGIGTTTPWSKLSIQDTYGSQNLLFDIASSTSAAYATSSLFRVLANGNVGIASTTPWRKFAVAGTVGFSSSISATTTNANDLCIDASTFEVTRRTTDCSGASSRRYKQNIEALSYGLTDVMKLNPVSFQYTEAFAPTDRSTKIGFVAEDMASVIPEVVAFDESGRPDSLDYSKLTSLLAKSIQQIATVVNMSAASTTLSSIYIDSVGNVGIGTSTPLYKMQVAGDIAATGFINVSTREAKKDITFLGETDYDAALEKIKTTEVATYNYISDTATDGGAHRLGLIAEQAPVEILSPDHRGVDLYKMTAFLWSGIKAQEKKIEELELKMADIEAKVAAMSGGNNGGESGGSSVSSTVSVANIAAFFNSMGASISSGVIQATEFVTNKLTAKKVVTNGLEMTDSVTGEVYCVRISNGEWNKFKGTCGEYVAEPTPAPATTPAPAAEPAPAPAPTSSPVPTITPTPTDTATTTVTTDVTTTTTVVTDTAITTPATDTATTTSTPATDTATTTPQI